MKLFLAFFFLSFCTFTFSQPAKDSAVIAQLIIADYKTLHSWDIEKHLQHCTANYILIENGDIQTLADESAYYKKNVHRKIERTDVFGFKKINITGNLGYAVYSLQSTIIENGNSKIFNWSESVICRKIKGQWKIELIHSTPVKS